MHEPVPKPTESEQEAPHGPLVGFQKNESCALGVAFTPRTLRIANDLQNMEGRGQ